MKIADRIDFQLIQLIAEQGFQSAESLARLLKASPSTVRRRIKRLQQSGALRIHALVNPVKLGLPLLAIVALDVAHGRADTVVTELAARPEVKWISVTTGRYDILAMVWFHSFGELSDFVTHTLGAINGISDTETFVCLHVKKGIYREIV